ncbi:MAG TPA: methyltransferase domain-containing protein, partial [Vicinamibacterales bacterium]|nr:methyltransferase domain-containing protein [Vicinamibacterales bacterium]
MIKTENDRARDAWNTNAAFWDERMADGNDFFHQLVWPGVERLLRPRAGERLLDVACGNGITCRRLARAGASVVAIDFSEEMIRRARERHADGDVEYRV